jgi:sec-independent protein translocase protein TatA
LIADSCSLVSLPLCAPEPWARESLETGVTRAKGCQCSKDSFNRFIVLVIVGIALLVFGPKKLPELGKGFGESIRGFKAAMKETAEEKPGTGPS